MRQERNPLEKNGTQLSPAGEGEQRLRNRPRARDRAWGSEARRGGKSIPAWLMSRGMIDSPIRAMPGPCAFTCSLAPGSPCILLPSPPSPSPLAFISLRAVQFIPHSRTVRTPIATTFNKYRINAFTARRTDGPIQTLRRRRVKFADRVCYLLSSRAFVFGRRSETARLSEVCLLRN